VKIYITARFKGNENKEELEELCEAVKASGMEDFCFIRDVENYQKIFEEPKFLWNRAKFELKKCDALLVDVTDAPSDGRIAEAGMAYAIGLPIFVIVKNNVEYKPLFSGIATKIITYDKYQDITEPLAEYLKDINP